MKAKTEGFLSKKEVVDLIGLSFPTIWRMEKEGKFPKRRQIAQNRVAYLAKEIHEWCEERQSVA